MSTAQRIWLMIAWFVLGTGTALAQDKVKIEVSVSAASGGSYYLDRGRSDGLEAGDRVLFFPSSGSSSAGTIRAVSKNSARVDLDPGSTAIVIGDRGEVFVPRDRIAPAPLPVKPAPSPSAPAPTPSAPEPAPPIEKPRVEHPPWTHPPEEWQKDTPLLAPAFGLSPEQRERRVRGRAWLQSQYTNDGEYGSSYSHSSTGVDATLENPFGKGGELRFNAAAWTRSFDAEFADDTQSRLRLNRFAYTVGGIEKRPTRWNIGRFLQTGLPEFGLLDGAEWNRRLPSGDDVGVSVGAMPVPTSKLTSFDDYQAAAFYRFALDRERRNTIALGYQNTWHEGEQDRNLFVAEARAEPGRDVSLRSAAWLDVYGAEDEIKGAGLELTEFLLGLTWRTSVMSGVGLTLSHRRLPELLRSEFQEYDAASVRSSKLQRVAVNGWTNVTPKIRLDARADHWRDEDDDGTAGEAGVALRDLLFAQGEVRASVFYAEGSYSSGPGVRVSGSKSFGRSAATLGYEFVDYEQKGFAGEEEQLAQQALFGTLDLPLWEKWDLSFLSDKRFGDRQDSWSVGIMLQTRF